jgi:hypothetical protein
MVAYQIPSQSLTFEERIKSVITAQQWPALYFCQGQPHHSRATEPSPVPLHGLLRTLRKLRSMTLARAANISPNPPRCLLLSHPPFLPESLQCCASSRLVSACSPASWYRRRDRGMSRPGIQGVENIETLMSRILLR